MRACGKTDLLTTPTQGSFKLAKTKSVYYVSLSTEEAHHSTHPTRGANMIARVNPHIAARISESVGEGITDPYEVRKALKHYVTTVLCASSNNPDPDDRAYYPTIRDLRNHIYKAKKALELSKLDQQNLKVKIEERKKAQPDSAFHFQPFIKIEQSEEKHAEGRNFNSHYYRSTRHSGRRRF